MRVVIHTFLLALVLISTQLFAQTGKISGIVKDSQTGEPLIGVNIVVEGTSLGAASDIEGYYAILNVKPGTYSLKASMIGYTASTVTDVKVSINQTTEINIDLKDQSIQTQEIVVVAKTPVVQKDVSASTVNLDVKQFENMPVVNVSNVIGLQAGIKSGLEIRGSSASSAAFMVNGLTLRDERDNTPFTAVSMTAIEEIQVQTGGFNAEYGNIRSGLINAVTREGKVDKYNVSFMGRYRPAGKKYFGDGASSPNSYWIRPYLDDQVAWTGTSAWDEYTRRQYPDFEGWNSISQNLLNDDDPNNDLTPAAAQKLFLWQHRKDMRIQDPDYDLDASVSGPVPVVSRMLGNLRFLASFRSSRQMYIIPLSTDNYNDYTAQIKFTSDLKEGMKLSVEGLTAKGQGTTNQRNGAAGFFTTATSVAARMQNTKASFGESLIYTTDWWAPSEVRRYMVGGKFTNVLSPKTFFEASASMFASRYSTNAGRRRDLTKKYEIFPGYFVDEGPFGFYEDSTISGINTTMFRTGGGGMSNGKDTSKVTVYNAKFDYTTQYDKFNQFKTGVEFTYTDNNVNYGTMDKLLPSTNTRYVWHTFPIRASMYLQDKIEYEGMIANVGVRMDYSNANTDWYVIENPFDQAMSTKLSQRIDELLKKEPTKGIVNFSPRLGVAFPITESSKLYFNYGHFRDMPTPENLYMVRRDIYTNNRVAQIADPNMPMPKTVAYELGYEQSLLDEYLIRIAGYYKDITQQPRTVTIQGKNQVNYTTPKPDSYEDIRGFELTLNKNRGNWIRGFVNYTYQVETAGQFNYNRMIENTAEWRVYVRDYRDNYQSKPVPQPYAKANIDFFTPSEEFGPEFGGIGLLTDWRLNIVGNWQAGAYYTWTGSINKSLTGVRSNVQWKDYWNVDLRFSKDFKFGPANLQLFVDVSNVFNTKNMSRYGFVDVTTDEDFYWQSLHLPDGIVDPDKFGYVNIPGDDQPGDYRKPGAPFTPIEARVDLSQVKDPKSSVIYWEKNRGKYFEYKNGDWQEVESGRIDKILDDKSYIDMPNQEFLSFLNPRNIFWGLRFSLELF